MNKGVIYKLYNEYGTYYGSTIQSLKERLRGHKKDAKTKNKSSKILFQNGCIPKIELIEEVDFDDIKELWDKEAYYIRNLECVNKNIPNRTKKERGKAYRDNNKDKIKLYNEKNKEYIKQWKKDYYETNKQIIIAKQEEKKKIKITCECGTVMRKDSIYKHKKTKKHLKYIEEKNSTIII